MIPIYVVKLDLTIQKTGIGVQKIENFSLEIYSMVLAKFLLQNSIKKVRLLKEIFLLANISMEMILELSFLSLGNAGVKFAKKLGKFT